MPALILLLQLGDSILKVEDEVTKLIKIIGVALLKDASADDLALMGANPSASASAPSAGGAEASSEFGRLTRLPGFSRMQRGLFYNLMTARPDVSEGNIRMKKAADAAAKHEGAKAKGTEDNEEPSLDRDTVKNISRLIYDRDAHPHGVKATKSTKSMKAR